MSSQKPPARDDAYAVFSQRAGLRLDLASWQRHAGQFFATTLGLVSETRMDAGFPWLQAMTVRIAPVQEGPPARFASGARLCCSRPTVDDDLRAALDAESRTGRAGLSDLAKRCPTVWLVESRPTADDEIDALALRIAAIVAGVELGPILSPHAAALFGPKTARARLGG